MSDNLTSEQELINVFYKGIALYVIFKIVKIVTAAYKNGKLSIGKDSQIIENP